LKNNWWTVVYSVVCALLGAGILFLVTRPPRGQPVLLLPAPTPIFIQVHVTGAVNQPGVFSLPPGSRVQEAIQLAGGSLPEADLQALNLARVLEDGERIDVPAISETPATRSEGLFENSLPTGYPIDLNTASQAELESLPGIGPVTAQAILVFRDQNGLFETIEDLQKVPGIGEKTFESLRELVTIGGR
jgi:competence protein ComEA